jgi:hypothetical protein
MLPRRCSGVVMAAIHLVFSSDSAPPSPVRSLRFIRWCQTLLQWHRPPPQTAFDWDGLIRQILQNRQSNRSRSQRRGVSIEHYCPRTKFTNISQEHRLPFIPLNASRRLLSTSALIVSMCFIQDKFTNELQEQEENRYTIYIDKWATK